MPDLSQHRVHLRWLLKLVDFRAAGELSWGSAVLAILYREMCGATQPNKAKIGGCLSLLQSWARFRFPFLHPRVNHPYTFPLITRWNHSTSYVGIPISLEDTASIRPTVRSTISMDTIRGSGNSSSNSG
ncbi:hypothetical protein PVK06_047285 [Gossypium arboreum]|uniref:Aminotransferase-like plant mobile domain-containing protein n=1 Tax=Gossypium arboreum TaxID=29729 RepID=A0ABR0MEW7_GOSAR|nr:hypothetical protein PVK06_047285 [Gossypium arboreum]